MTEVVEPFHRSVLSFFKNEPNAILHLLATIAVSLLVIIVRVSHAELVALIVVIGFFRVGEHKIGVLMIM